MYCIAETLPHSHITAQHWTSTRATSLAAAKRAASRARTFRGTAAHVGIKLDDGSIERVATCQPASCFDAGWNDI